MNSSEYWEKRSLALMRKLYNSQEKENKALIKLYKEVLRDIKGELEVIYSKIDNISLSDAYKYDRLNKLKMQIEENIKKISKEEIKIDKNILEKTYKGAYEEISKELKLDFSKLNKEAIKRAVNYEWSGTMFSDIIWKNTSNLIYNIKNTITKGLVEGKSYIEMARELNKVMENGLYNSLRVIRTETAHIVNQATLDRYKDSGLVKEVRIIAAEDERMCDTCGSFHNKIFKIDKVPIMPLHSNCRCCVAPVIEV